MPTLRGAGTKGGSADAGNSMVADGGDLDGQEPNTTKPLQDNDNSTTATTRSREATDPWFWCNGCPQFDLRAARRHAAPIHKRPLKVL